MSITSLNAYQQGGPILGKLKDLWGRARGLADDPSWGYMGASMIPGIGEYTDLVEIGAGLQDRDPLRVALGGAALALPFVAAPALRKMLPGSDLSRGEQLKTIDRGIREEWVRAQNRHPDRMLRLRGSTPTALSDEEQLLENLFAPQSWKDPEELVGVRGLGIMHRWRNRKGLKELRGQAEAAKKEAQDHLEKLKRDRDVSLSEDFPDEGHWEGLNRRTENELRDEAIFDLESSIADNRSWEDWLSDDIYTREHGYDAINMADEMGHPSLSRALELRLKQGIGGLGLGATAPIRALTRGMRAQGMTKPWWMPQAAGPNVSNITDRMELYGGKGGRPLAEFISDPVTQRGRTRPMTADIGIQEGFEALDPEHVHYILLDQIAPFRPEWLKTIMPDEQWDLLKYPNREYVHPQTGESFDDFSKYAEKWLKERHDLTFGTGSKQLPKPNERMLGYVLTDDALRAREHFGGDAFSPQDIADMLKGANRMSTRPELDIYDDVIGSVAPLARGEVNVGGPGVPQGGTGELTPGIFRAMRQGPAQDLRNLGLDLQSIGAGMRTGGKRAKRPYAFTHPGMEIPAKALDKSLLYTKAGVPVSSKGLKSLLDITEAALGGGSRRDRSLVRYALRPPSQLGPLAHMASRRSNALNEDQGTAPSPPALPRMPQVIETPEEQERRRIEELLRQDVPPPIFRSPIG